jgi:hypothetical protein
VSDQSETARAAAEEERAMREHEREAREHDPVERGPEAGSEPDRSAPPGGVDQSG